MQSRTPNKNFLVNIGTPPNMFASVICDFSGARVQSNLFNTETGYLVARDHQLTTPWLLLKTSRSETGRAYQQAGSGLLGCAVELACLKWLAVDC